MGIFDFLKMTADVPGFVYAVEIGVLVGIFIWLNLVTLLLLFVLGVLPR